MDPLRDPHTKACVPTPPTRRASTKTLCGRQNIFMVYTKRVILGCFVSVVCTVEVDGSPPLENTAWTPLGTRTQKHVCPRHPHVELARKLFAEDIYFHGIHKKGDSWLFC